MTTPANPADLITWLRAQLDEDEATASAATAGPWRPWRGRPGLGLRQLEHAVVAGEQSGVAGELARIATESWLDAEHIARHDPARVLAEVDAKRRILDRCAEAIGDRDLSGYDRFGSLADEPNALALFLAVETMRDLALPYADRPGYREEWRPA